MRASSSLRARLLRRHVGHRAQRRARTGQVLLVAWPRSACCPTWLADSIGICILASPKSRILACPRSVTKMFAGLMSRWTMPLACAASSASAISMRQATAAFRSPAGVPAMRCFSVCPPETPSR